MTFEAAWSILEEGFTPKFDAKQQKQAYKTKRQIQIWQGQKMFTINAGVLLTNEFTNIVTADESFLGGGARAHILIDSITAITFN